MVSTQKNKNSRLFCSCTLIDSPNHFHYFFTACYKWQQYCVCKVMGLHMSEWQTYWWEMKFGHQPCNHYNTVWEMGERSFTSPHTSHNKKVQTYERLKRKNWQTWCYNVPTNGLKHDWKLGGGKWYIFMEWLKLLQLGGISTRNVPVL